jgi:hypothetical protein
VVIYVLIGASGRYGVVGRTANTFVTIAHNSNLQRIFEADKLESA